MTLSPYAKRGKNASERRHRNDPGWTPTEKRTKDRLMKQFTKGDGPKGASEAYVNSAVWCRCGRGMNRPGKRGDTLPCIHCRPDLKSP